MTVTRIGADIGGTFTDVALVDDAGRLRIGKHLTTHAAAADGVLAALGSLEVGSGQAIVAHGHTLVINALLERRGARVALVTTEGFGDVIEIGRCNRPEIFNLRYHRDAPLVPRQRRFEVRERVSASGVVEQVPDGAELDRLVERLRRGRVDAVAVVFLNAYAEPANERLVGERIARALPGVPVSLSSDLSREWREYERTVTTAANAYVSPLIGEYMHSLRDRLTAAGAEGELVLLDSAGGALDVADACRYPVRTVESGPVAGVLGARALAGDLGLDNVVTFDMGGTTAKCCVVERGRFATTELYWIGGYERGLPLQVRSVDVTEVGAGGGSIAWVDDSGRLRVGPRSAGSHPGPASYGLGGSEPTVTDADVYCGRIDSDHFVGSLTLDGDAAAAAIAGLARRLDLKPPRLALGILRLANLSMAAAVRRQTLERGRDPREFTLVAFGGAGPMHACEVAAEVGISRVVVPLFPGHFSAIGMLGVDLRLDRREVFRSDLDSLDGDALGRALQRVGGELAAEPTVAADISPGEVVFSYSLALRYHGQDHTLLIPIAESGLGVPADAAGLARTAFEDEYLLRYGHLDERARIEIVEIEVVAERRLPRAPISSVGRSTGPSGRIESFFELGGARVTTDVVARGSLAEGDTFAGPLVVYEEGATTVVPPGARGRVAAGGSLLLEVGRG